MSVVPVGAAPHDPNAGTAEAQEDTIWGFPGHSVCVAWTYLCPFCMEAATGKT